MNKINVAVIFGGKSGEHEVSLMSATSVIKAMNKEKYNCFPIGITKEGNWMIYNGPIEKIETGEWEEISKNQGEEIFSIIPMNGKKSKLKEIADVVFPVLHGPFGEDGTIQGLLEMADLPYVGAGVLASSLGMDKILSKKIFEKEGLPVGKYTFVMKYQLKEDIDRCIKEIEEEFSYPVFIKPANLGSSVGISKAHNREELIKGLNTASLHDRKIIIEAYIQGREIECAVLGNDHPKASVLGEILPSHEFYDYQAKYSDDQKSRLVIPADLPKEKSDEIRKMAICAYKAIDGSGLSRVDFFVEKDSLKVYINEVNTMPGFTKYSMYPLLWEATGLSYENLIDELINLAIKRYKDR
ncbi:D-alanine--D-alanine ligase [Inediibacterium massiliense]|uniref:D-alanine--D-alanine ligase n=1 Tax=Inediibacterium massiliense TaxID=1658111 RepID=UPI0006B58AFD|nr:D-alanine--D-alanine ligase [Inediibacterium massiliense]